MNLVACLTLTLIQFRLYPGGLVIDTVGVLAEQVKHLQKLLPR